MNVHRTTLEVDLLPLAGTRLQPTGFPDLGAAEFETGDGRKALIVESAQSMANRLEATTWDEGRADQVEELRALPYVRVLDQEGKFLTSSRLEAHRLASAYIMEAKVRGTTGEDWLLKEFGLAKGRPLDYRAVASACFRLDPVSLVHGVFFARKPWPWQPKIARAVTSFIEAYDVRPAVSGGVKRDIVINVAEAGATARGYGSVPHHRVEYTAKTITAFFSVDLAQFRSYGLSEPATALLEALADFEIATLLDGGLRLRTACDLVVDPGGVRGERPDAQDAAQRIAKLAADCAAELGPVTEVVWAGRASDMGTTLDIHFPLGQYHATPWERSVNEGAVEWPPSPWRVLRALIATWYTRWPDLSATTFDGLLDALADPPAYYTPVTRPAHTRHYLPDLDHKKGEQGGTDLTLDPFLSVGHDEPLLIRWDVDLDPEQRAVLAKLAELMPYLGRAESVCQARLCDDDLIPDEHWWRPGADGNQHVRRLAPVRPVSRSALEISTVEVRRQRRTMPPSTTWVDYARSAPPLVVPETKSKANAPLVHAVRYAVMGRVPFKSANAILLADDAHRVLGKDLAEAAGSNGRASSLLGTKGARSGHSHAHWVPIADGWERGASVRSLVLWVSQGLTATEVANIVAPKCFSGRRGSGRDGEEYEIRGYPEVKLIFQAAGTIDQVAPELACASRRWRSLTPYLPVRHRKRELLDEYLAADIGAELAYRNECRDLAPPMVMTVEGGDKMPDRWASEFRRYRLTERMNKSRPGLGIRLEFAEPVAGPLLLGQLSHFGYGIFVPEEG